MPRALVDERGPGSQTVWARCVDTEGLFGHDADAARHALAGPGVDPCREGLPQGHRAFLEHMASTMGMTLVPR
ncbi:hypothetical protein PV392_26180 [Streptomyces sp. ME03-5709C]|nr:hypothetical protein [Streptomyces sp. ME03-5709C]